MKEIYKVNFLSQGKLVQLHAKSIAHSPTLLGFLEVKDFVFPKISKVIVDPNSEKIQDEFEKLSTTFIPVNLVTRIDMVPYNPHEFKEDEGNEPGDKVVPLRPHNNA